MRRGVNPTMMDRSNRHSQTLTSAKALEAAKVIRRKCSNVSSRPGRQRFFHTQAGYMYATTFLLTGSPLLQPGEGPYMRLHPRHRKRGSPAACPQGRISEWWQWGQAVGVPTSETTSATRSFLSRCSIVAFNSYLCADVMESTARIHRWSVHFFMGITS